MRLIFIPLLCLALHVTSQDYCFKNDGLKTTIDISFTIDGDKVLFGEWQESNYGTTNAEIYGFNGYKKNNKLYITFLHAHPHTLSSNVSTAIWALEKNILTIPMNQKNHQTRKYENSLTNFEKCVNENEETEVDASQCTCVAYITDDDTKGLNVRKQGNKTAEILTVIPQQLDGTNVMITGTSNNGWVLISKANDANGVNILKSKGYVFGQKLGVSISAYDKRKAMLYFEPNIKSKLITTVPSESSVSIVDCKGKWLKVKYNNQSGWLRAEDQCANPNSNCN